MHTITALDGDLTIGPLSLSRDVPAIVEDVNAGEVLALSEDRFECRPWHPPGFRVPPRTDPPSSLLFILPGGLGDILQLTPVLGGCRRLLGDGGRLAVSCFRECSAPLHHLPFSLEILAYPLAASEAEKFDSVICGERLISGNPGKVPVDLFAEAAGVVLLQEEKRCLYTVTTEERAWAVRQFPLMKRVRVGLHVRASADCRTYPPGLQVEIIRLLASKARCDVFIFGGKGECLAPDSPEEGVINLCNHPLTFRQSCALLGTCDGFIAPDSSLCHVAGALDIPTVGLFGPFRWQSRALYHPNVYGINGAADCAPCHHHKRGGREWPEGGPCVKDGYCHALAAIPPERVVAKLEQIMGKSEPRRTQSTQSL